MRRALLAAAAGRAAGSITYEFLQSAVSAADASSYTFSSQSLGTAASDRTILVVVASRWVGTTITMTSVTVAGQAVTVDVSAANTGGGNTTLVAIGHVLVPSGTTGDVVVTMSGGALRCGIALYRLQGLGSVAGTGTSLSGTSPITVTGAAGGLIVTAGYTAASSVVFINWGPAITEDWDTLVELRPFSGGRSVAVGSVSIDNSLSTEGAIAAVAYSP